MKSRLLGRRELESLAETGSLDGLIAALTKTVYQKSVEAALTRATGMQCIDEALHNDLVITISKIRGFYTESAKKMVAIFLTTYDIHNLKAILRGLSKNVPAGVILTVLLPIGELDMNLLRELAQLNNPREAIDMLSSMGNAFAWPLLNMRSETPGAETFEMELTLDQWFYQKTHQTLRSETGLVDPLSHAMALEADLANILTVLRFAQNPQECDLLRDRIGTDDITHLFIGPGRIPYDLLANACKQDTVASAVDTLSGSSFEPALRAGLEAYAHSNRLSDIERKLRHYRLVWMAGQITQDSLGIGVVIGYLALKVNEISNIRWIVHGINLGLKVDTIRAELEMVA